jgi:hypothetical protein
LLLSRYKLERKPDAEQIRSFLDELARQPWLGQTRSWWPRYVFRVDNIDAAARILRSGRILSRAAALASGVLATDAASPKVMAQTDAQWLSYVRLYFRPRTPTQFHSEGFRSAGNYGLGAHCPAPVVFLLDSAEILTRVDTLFSDGNLAAAGSLTGRDVTFLRDIPFEKVYHQDPLGQSEMRSIIFHRCAEIAVPHEVELDALAFIGCRTQAEYETLLHLLDETTRDRWAKHVGVLPRLHLHYRGWTFVEEVELSRTIVRFSFNPSSKERNPFRARVEFVETATGQRYVWEQQEHFIGRHLELDLQPVQHTEDYTVALTLDGDLAYKNRYTDLGLPF